jgi:hypothetical protein
MMNTKLAALFFLLILSPMARAGFTGRWLGTGQFQTSTGQIGNCNAIQFIFVESATTLDMQQARYECVNPFDLPPTVFTKRGTQLYAGNVLVGTLYRNNLNLQFTLNGVAFQIQLQIVRDWINLGHIERYPNGATGMVRAQLDLH